MIAAAVAAMFVPSIHRRAGVAAAPEPAPPLAERV
jgi:hypothetical protein